MLSLHFCIGKRDKIHWYLTLTIKCCNSLAMYTLIYSCDCGHYVSAQVNTQFSASRDSSQWQARILSLDLFFFNFFLVRASALEQQQQQKVHSERSTQSGALQWWLHATLRKLNGRHTLRAKSKDNSRLTLAKEALDAVLRKIVSLMMSWTMGSLGHNRPKAMRSLPGRIDENTAWSSWGLKLLGSHEKHFHVPPGNPNRS